MTIDTKKVLAMLKWEQANFLFQHTNQKPYKERSKSHWFELAGAIDAHDAGSVTADYLLERALSHLAFRLRDEAVRKNAYAWEDACNEVFKMACEDWDERDFDVWWQDNSEPIHWILAALLAKENE